MTKTEDITECANCGEIIDTTNDTSTQRTPCINCGSTARIYHANIIENVQALDGLEMKGKRPGKKKPFFEDMSKPDYYHKKKKFVHKERLIDRDNDKYREKITDYQTGKTIHHCEEPLSEHFVHGSEKFKKKK